MIINETINNIISSPVRSIKAKVESFNGSTLVDTYSYDGALKSISIERVGEQKFFGFGICQKLNFHLVDVFGQIKEIPTANHLKVYFDDINNFPDFYVTENHRDENTNELSITAYDKIYSMSGHYTSELSIEPPYTIRGYAEALAGFLGGSLVLVNVPEEDVMFGLEYAEGANLEGTETIREALNAVADATQTIYYLDSAGNLVFKRLDLDGPSVLQIGKTSYIKLDSKDNRRLATITHATQLGDNISASTLATGSTHFVRDNPFWELREDITTIVDNALATVGGLTIGQFNCAWRGNYLLELGDKIGFTAKDNSTIITYLLDDVITYNGSFSEQTKWEYADNENETASNPSTIGDIVKFTYAKVDKVNKQVDIVVSEVGEYTEAISSLQLTTNNITASVGDINNDIGELSERVNASITSEELTIEVQKSLAGGVDKVITTTGFTFNDEGLNVSKTGSEMTTQITEDGMTVSRGSGEVLTADNTGVKAENLTATTYLIVGVNSRFENYDNGRRTGCFWIGG